MGKRNRSAAVIGYLRVSTEEQATSGLGLADQRAAIGAEAQRKGWNSVEYVTDDGYSAKSLARPGITDALDRLRAGKAGVLVVSKLDRLSRSVHDFTGLIATAKREGWELVVLDLALDTGTPNGKFMASVLASVAELERDLISARTSAAMQQLKAQGKRLGRPRVMTEHVTERIVSEREEGKTLAAIAAGLNSDAVPTARGGARWYPSTVKAVLTSASLDAVAVA
jgi:DNA invertase Pin-like site-specific DNA recombinase